MDKGERELLELRAVVDTLVEILVAKEVLAEGHKRLFDKVRKDAGMYRARRVQLRTYEDKYAIEGADIDCASLLHLCRARCCSFRVTMTVQDLEEGSLRWNWAEPYLLRQGDDGYCEELDRDGGGCRAYRCRPAICRSYDCRDDDRVWKDFDRRIPAPMPDGVSPTALRVPAGED